MMAPHPDDESFGCGGALLRHGQEGDSIHWIIVTQMDETGGYSKNQMKAREILLSQIAESYQFASVNRLEFATANLDSVPMGEIVRRIGNVFKKISPEIVYLPYRGDVHSDHWVVFDATIACTKWFRFPGIRRILAYETLSETDFGLNPDANGFRPTVFIDIANYLGRKLQILEQYNQELGAFPFPRSLKAVEALAMLRGSTAGSTAAEAFMLLKEVL